MTAREQEAQSLRISAARLLDLADQLERPVPAPDRKPGHWRACGTCGAEYAYAEGYRTGQHCESCEERGQVGYLRRVAEQSANVVACDQCGRSHDKEYRIDTPCWKGGCAGRFRPVDEELMTTDGRSLGVTMSALAASQAVQDAMADDLDIASTYRGGRVG